MPIFSFQTRLDDLRHAILNKECHRATCNLMDFIHDYIGAGEYLTEAIEIRKYYNSKRELGTADIGTDEIDKVISRTSELYNKISSFSYQQIEDEMKSRFPERPVLVATNLEKKYPGGKFKLGPVNANLYAGQITGIVGENGNGKTTLLRILSTLLNFNSGKVEYFFDGNLITEDYLVKNQIAYIPQRVEKWQGTLKENLHYAASIHGIHGEENELAVEYVIHRMGLSNFADLGWSALSSGYKLRFELAKMLVWSPKLLVLDEPLANLDINAQQWLLQDFRNIAGSVKNPVSIILSSQQLHEVENVADNIIFLRNGHCEYSGRMGEFMQERLWNVFEIAGNFSATSLQSLFNDPDYSFLENGSSVTVKTSLEVSSSDLLRSLLDKGLSIKYFRDISTSTKQLFQL